MSTEWQEDALCRSYPNEWFFPEPGHSDIAAKGKKVCRACPVQQQCLEHILANPAFGTWGGLTEHDRTKMRLPLQPRIHRPQVHGTLAGYTRHQRAGESPCASCKNAQRIAAAERRSREAS
jgi:WhiB family transcriptional regulator, redox-sensing transcriptional regulator